MIPLLEQYVAVGDHLQTDPFTGDGGIDSPNAFSLFGQEVHRTLGCSRSLSFASEAPATLGTIYRRQLPAMIGSRCEVIITITAGMDDIVELASENIGIGSIRGEIRAVADSFGRLIKTVRRNYPNALIIVGNVPTPPIPRWSNLARVFPSDAAPHFNDRIAAQTVGWLDVVTVDLHTELAPDDCWSRIYPMRLSGKGAEVVARTFSDAVEATGYVHKAVA